MKRLFFGFLLLIVFSPFSYAEKCLQGGNEIGGSVRTGQGGSISFGSCIRSTTIIYDSPLVIEQHEAPVSTIYEYSPTRNYSFTDSRIINDATYGNVNVLANISAQSSVKLFKLSGHFENSEDDGDPDEKFILSTLSSDAIDTLTFISDHDDFDVTGTLCYSFITNSTNSVMSFAGNFTNSTTNSSSFITLDQDDSPVGNTCETITISSSSSKNTMIGTFGLSHSIIADKSTTDYSISFELDTLPDGVSCTSLSGVFPGCEENNDNPYTNVIPEKCPFGCESSVGNPVNLALGFKHERVTDYSADNLSFTRYYRSDAEWYSNSIGEHWRHNFDRSVTINGSEVELVTESGLHYTFVNNGTSWSAKTEDNDLMGVFGEENGGYFFTDSNETKNIFDSTGTLTRIEYRGGKYVDLVYTSGNLTSITDQNGRALTLGYTGNYLSQVITPEYTLNYGQDTNGNLVTVGTSDGNGTMKIFTYLYEETEPVLVHALTGTIDENNIRLSTYDYDVTTGRAISTEHAGGVGRFDIQYLTNGDVRVTRAVDTGLSKSAVYKFETIKGVRRLKSIDGEGTALCPAASKIMDYDANGWLISKTDWKGNETSFTRDAATGLVLTKTEKNKDNVNEFRTTTYTYWPGTRLLKSFYINGTNKLTEYEYDNGRRTKITVTDNDPNNTVSRVTTTAYIGSTFKVDTITQPNGAVTKYTYDANDLVSSITRAYGQAYAQTTNYTYDGAQRIDITTEVRNPGDPSDDYITKFEYDIFGRLFKTTGNYGATNNEAITQYFYNDNGTLDHVVTPNGTTLFYTYDNAQRVKTVTSGVGDDPIVTEYSYNLASDITEEVRYRNSASPLYNVVRQYDELSRLVRMNNGIDRDNNGTTDESSYQYNVNSSITKSIDANGNDTTYVYDYVERISEIQDALYRETKPTVFINNDLDQMNLVVDSRFIPTLYSYNAFGDITKETSPDRGEVNYSYNNSGNLTQRTDARGIITNYTYDLLNRVSTVTYPTDSANDVTYTYDISAYCAYGWGKLCKVEDASGYIEYQYDAFGQIAVERHFRDIGGQMGAYTLAYGYDLSGLTYATLLPSSNAYTYGRDANGRVRTVKYGLPDTNDPTNQNFTQIVSNAQYLPSGPLTSMHMANGINVTNTYNLAYELTSKTVGLSGQTPLISDTYSRDAAGNIIEKGSTTYGLDVLDRILSENSTIYALDEIGNRLSKDSTQYTYITDSSLLETIGGGSTITYDWSGNIENYTNGRSFTYDDAGRVATFNDGTTTTTYTYNAFNQRTAKTTGGVTTYYIYGHDGLLYGEYQGVTKLREYVYMDGEPVAQIETSGAITYLHTDHLATPRKASDALGMEVWSWNSDAFGNGTLSGNTTVNLRFPGQYFDSESNLHYNWNRYYDPETGRYITSDPIGLEGGLNTYSYAMQNPLMYFDPQGLATWNGTLYVTRALTRIIVFSLELEACDSVNNQYIEMSVIGYGGEKDYDFELKDLIRDPRDKLIELSKRSIAYELLNILNNYKSNNISFEDGSGSNSPDPSTFSGLWKYSSGDLVFFKPSYLPGVGAVSVNANLGNKYMDGFSFIDDGPTYTPIQ